MEIKLQSCNKDYIIRRNFGKQILPETKVRIRSITTKPSFECGIEAWVFLKKTTTKDGKQHRRGFCYVYWLLHG
jgi:hypothetical protein